MFVGDEVHVVVVLLEQESGVDVLAGDDRAGLRHDPLDLARVAPRPL